MIPQTNPQPNPFLRVYSNQALQSTGAIAPAYALSYLDPAVTVTR
jgi:hypothetical protein